MTRDEIEAALLANPFVRWWDTGVRVLDDGQPELRYIVSFIEGEPPHSWTTDEVVAWIES